MGMCCREVSRHVNMEAVHQISVPVKFPYVRARRAMRYEPSCRENLSKTYATDGGTSVPLDLPANGRPGSCSSETVKSTTFTHLPRLTLVFSCRVANGGPLGPLPLTPHCSPPLRSAGNASCPSRSSCSYQSSNRNLRS